MKHGQIAYSKAKNTTIHLPETYIEGLTELVRRGHFVTVSEAIRIAVRDFLKREAKVLNITYNELIGVEA